MGKEQKHPLRALVPQEEQELQRVVKATSERLDVVKRARALLGVRAGQSKVHIELRTEAHCHIPICD